MGETHCPTTEPHTNGVCHPMAHASGGALDWDGAAVPWTGSGGALDRDGAAEPCPQQVADDVVAEVEERKKAG